MAGTITQITPVKLQILIYFHDLMAYYKRTYCWPTRATIVKAIYKKCGREFSLSWIDDCLHWLNENKFIRSYFQPGTKDDGTWFNRPSNRQITLKGFYFMKRMGIGVARFLWDTGKKLSPPKDPTPISQQKPPDPPDKFPPKTGGNPSEIPP